MPPASIVPLPTSDWRGDERALLLRAAAIACREESPAGVDDVHGLQVRSLLARRNGQPLAALALLQQAMQFAPDDSWCVSDLGELLAQLGRADAAVAAHRRAVALAPEDVVLRCRLGAILLRQGLRDEARDEYEQALTLEPQRARTHGELGAVHEAAGQLRDAIACYDDARGLEPDEPEWYVRLGRASLQEDDPARALTDCLAGLDRCGARVDLLLGAGDAQLALGSLERAATCFGDAVALDPRDIAACRKLTTALERLGRSDEAVDAWCGLGVALQAADRFEEAAAIYRVALLRRPNALRALFGLGTVLLQFAKPREAIPYFEAVLAIKPEHVLARQRRGRACAALGDLQPHWDAIAQMDERTHLWTRFEQPIWDGSPLDGKTILLSQTAGLGDAIQLVRYAALLEGRGLRILVECERRLVLLFKSMPCLHGVHARGAPVPAFDLHASFFSLPRILQTRVATIPACVPYLAADSGLVEKWRRRLTGGSARLVGLAWGGHLNPEDGRFRFAPLAAFAPLAGMAGVRFISLQRGPQRAELLAPPDGLIVEQLEEESSPLEDTAALIANLDLVISVDTMVAHLAGALATPVWTLLAHSPDWRWMLDTESSPWYPTMRLFRQARPGDWGELMERVRAAIEAMP